MLVTHTAMHSMSAMVLLRMVILLAMMMLLGLMLVFMPEIHLHEPLMAISTVYYRMLPLMMALIVHAKWIMRCSL